MEITDPSSLPANFLQYSSRINIKSRHHFKALLNQAHTVERTDDLTADHKALFFLHCDALWEPPASVSSSPPVKHSPSVETSEFKREKPFDVVPFELENGGYPEVSAE